MLIPTARSRCNHFSFGLLIPVCCALFLLFASMTVASDSYDGSGGSGSISGQVSGDNDMWGISGFVVRAYDSSTGSEAGSAYTLTDGLYYISGLMPGSYVVEADASGTDYLTQYFDNTLNYASAQPVAVNDGENVPGIDFFLESADSGSTGQISGTLTSGDDGQPVEGVTVCAYPASCTSGCSDEGVCTQTDVYGIYLLELPMGDYIICSQSTDTYEGECYDHVPDMNDATPVFVGGGSAVEAIDFSPVLRVTAITGTVTRDADGQPIAGLTVYAHPEDQAPSDSDPSAQTGADGSYLIADIEPGAYAVRVDTSGTFFRSEYFDDACEADSASSVWVESDETVSEVDFGLVEGGVTDATDNRPLAGLTVHAELLQEFSVQAHDADTGESSGWASWQEENRCHFSGSAQTDANGNYTIEGMPAGTYHMRLDPTGTDYIGEYFNNASEPAAADPVVVRERQTTGGTDFSLNIGGQITGNVMSVKNDEPAGSVTVTARHFSSGFTCATTRSLADGTFRLTGLPTGSYRVQTRSTATLIGEYFNDAGDAGSAEPVEVTAESATSGIDFRLISKGTITGTVTRASDDAPVSDMRVEVLDFSSSQYGSRVGYAYTDDNGAYTIDGLPPGQYRVRTDRYSFYYVTQYYSRSATFEGAVPVVITDGGTVAGVDFSLMTGGSISGYVTADSDGQPIEDIYVSAELYDESGGYDYYGAYSDADGFYEIDKLPPGDYRVSVYSDVYVGEYYNDTPSYSDAMPVTVVDGAESSDINFSLTASGPGGIEASGAIKGTVTRASDGEPIGGFSVYAYEESTGNYGGSCYISSYNCDGTYVISGLSPGKYRVRTNAYSDYINEYYDDTDDPDSATPVDVTAGNTTSDIDFSLASYAAISGSVKAAGSTVVIGTYRIEELVPGDYRIEITAAGSGYLGQYYDHAADAANAASVQVLDGQSQEGIDFDLIIGEDSTTGAIGGRVTRTSDGAFLAGMPVYATAVSGDDPAVSAVTRLDGTFLIAGLIPGDYTIKTGSVEGDSLLTEYYLGVHDAQSATPVGVGEGQSLSGIDFNLDRGGSITGTITGDPDGRALAGVSVTVRLTGSDEEPEYHATTRTDGSYDIHGLPPGTYRMNAGTAGTPHEENYRGEYYRDAPDADSATLIEVGSGEHVPGIDAGLALREKITGFVTGEADGQPVNGLTIRVYQFATGTYVGSATTHADGSYSVSVDPGSYKVRAGYYDSDFVEEYYDNAPSSGTASEIRVEAGRIVSGIDFSLIRGGRISGVVSGAQDGQPIAGMWVAAYNADTGSYETGDSTGSTGVFSITRLPPGSYLVRVDSEEGIEYAGEYFDNVYDKTLATPLEVAAGASISGIDFTLEAGGKISGNVTGAADGNPLEGLPVYALTCATGDYVGRGESKADGSYVVYGLPTGCYKVRASTYGTDLIDAYYSNVSNIEDAAEVNVTAEQITSGIDFSLQQGGSIAGTVVDARSGGPIAGVYVAAYDYEANTYARSGRTGDDGTYSIRQLLPGDYAVKISSTGGTPYQRFYYDQAVSRDAATTVSVDIAQTTPGIDFALEPDADQDGLSDALETSGCTALNDADSDDDGISDSREDENCNGAVDSGETDPCNPDTDQDGVQDGTESGYSGVGLSGDTDWGVFRPDRDPTTTTNPLLADTDGDGLLDGQEDANGNGRVDFGEIDPNRFRADLDGDGCAGLSDAIAALQILTGLDVSLPNSKAADADGNAVIGMEEVYYIVREIAGIEQ